MIWRRVTDAYRWRKILSSCQLSIEELESPLDAPGSKDFIIAGCPRTGTSLLAATLFQPPDLIVSMEPWDGLRMPPAKLFESLRSEIEKTGALSRGRLDVSTIRNEGRVAWQRDGEKTHAVSVDQAFHLGVKWPTFWQYLDLLDQTKFLITLRHPAEVVTSFGQVGGRLSQGFGYDVPFNARMNATVAASSNDPMERRALMYEYINSRIEPHLGRTNVLAIRYERWTDDPAELLSEIAEFLGVRYISPKVEIHPMKSRTHPDEFTQLIRRLCPSASRLGYVI